MKKRAILKIHGRVQGVFYRDGAREKAEELGLSGTVRNLGDGTVEVVIEGEKDLIDKFITWANEGSFNAQVDEIKASFKKCQDEFKNFTIIA